MSSRSAQFNTPDAIASNTFGTGEFPVYPCEEPNSKDGDDFWRGMDNILDKHPSFGYMERNAPPPSHLRYRLASELGVTVLPLPAATGSPAYMTTVKHNSTCSEILRKNEVRTAELVEAETSDNRHLAAAID